MATERRLEGFCGMNDRIQRARELAGLLQAQLAKILKVDRGWVFDLESGEREPTDAELATLAELFCVSVDYLRGDDTETVRVLGREFKKLTDRDRDKTLEILDALQ